MLLFKSFCPTHACTTLPERCSEYRSGTATEMGGRRFQRWVGCNFDLIKFCGDFSSVYWFQPNAQTFGSIRTVLNNAHLEIAKKPLMRPTSAPALAKKHSIEVITHARKMLCVFYTVLLLQESSHTRYHKHARVGV